MFCTQDHFHCRSKQNSAYNLIKQIPPTSFFLFLFVFFSLVVGMNVNLKSRAVQSKFSSWIYCAKEQNHDIFWRNAASILQECFRQGLCAAQCDLVIHCQRFDTEMQPKRSTKTGLWGRCNKQHGKRKCFTEEKKLHEATTTKSD